MFNDSLVWTMHLKTDKKAFSDAFYKVLEESADKVIISDEWQGRYFGRIYSESAFKIRKQYEHATEQLEGTMREDANGLLLELHLRPAYNSLWYATLVFIVSAMISILIACIPFAKDLLSDYYFILTATVLMLPVFPVVFWLGLKFRAISALGLKAGFIDVLNEIEKEVEHSKR